MNRQIIFTVLMILLSLCSYAQHPGVSFSQLDSLQKKEPRNVLVFMHTEWCRYCRAMEQTTFKNAAVREILNSRFYLVFLNAEEKKDILFNRNVFKYKPTGNGTGIHELAEELGTIGENVAYPSVCFLNIKNEIIYRQADYINANDLKYILDRLK